ncbi:MAG: hypothetical protein HUU38_10475 [Anaerolineales bacterium]|nr:hypothetical protein [Anaerolineales bacterium]
MLVLNFSHPLTPSQRTQLEEITGDKITEICDIPAHFDHAQPFAEQIRALIDSIALTPKQWQTTPLLLVPPAYNFAAMTLLAELHGRMGYFPAIVRIRPIEGRLPPQYEIAEIINLQEIRADARTKR